MAPKVYYYYTQWWLEGSEECPEGMYHSTHTSGMRPKEFLANIYDRAFIGEFFVKQFETKEEMREYWDSKQERRVPNNCKEIELQEA